MKEQSHCYVPSFDSLPYMQRDQAPIQQSMLFITSRRQLECQNSIQNEFQEMQPQKPSPSSISLDYLDAIQSQKGPQIKTEDSFQPPSQIHHQSFNPSHQPLNEKRRGCVCKKTGCIKLYCECFRRGQTCTQHCSCCNCSNVHTNSKIIQDTRAIRKRRSKNNGARPYCHCKKTLCVKKYCQCYNFGIKCGLQCKCQGCENCGHQ